MRHRLALLLVLACAYAAGAAPADSLLATPAGKRIQDYLNAYNSGDDAAMRAFIVANFSDSALAQRGPDERIAGYHRVRADIPRMEFVRLVNAESGATTVAVRNGDGPLQLVFTHESVPPHKLIGLRINRGAPAETRPAGSALSEPAVLDSIHALLTQKAAADSFSGAVLIAHNGTPILRKAWGLADREHHVANTPETKFNLGSIGKSFTRLAIEKMMSEGKLAATDKLGKFLPDYPNADARSKVTVQQLLDMRSGIGDFFGQEFLDTPRDRIRSLPDYLPLFAAKPLEFEPGSKERYSNGGFVVLGLIIEKLTGKSYYDYIKEAVFVPAGMKDSGWWGRDEIVPDRAVGYTHRWQPTEEDSPELRSNVLIEPGIGSSAGGGYSTADDLLKFVNALQAGTLKCSEGGGMGIAGGAPGLNAAIESGLPGGYTVIVLCNSDPPSAENMAAMLRGWMMRAKS
jgi:D-alanyl-D-alanine carboxypeptidase